MPIFGIINATANLLVDGMDVVEDTFEGRFDKHKVARLAAAGMTAVAIAEMLDVSVDLVEKALED